MQFILVHEICKLKTHSIKYHAYVFFILSIIFFVLLLIVNFYEVKIHFIQ